jgi:endonuclease III
MTETEFRFSEVSRRLVKRYRRRAPKRDTHPEDPLEELIHTILSQQNIGIVTQRLYDALKRAFPTWTQALEAGSDAIQRVLEATGGGLAAVKARSIHRCLRQILEARGELSLEFLRRESLGDARDFLEALPGVGPKTSGCVLMFELRLPAMPVDTHIHRLAKRLEFVGGNISASQTQTWFETHLPDTWKARYEFHVNAFTHGRETCKAQRPRCRECVLLELCPSGATFLALEG